MVKALLLALSALGAQAFVPSRAVSQRTLKMVESEPALPSLDDFLKQPTTPKNESPLVDRVRASFQYS